MIAYLNMNLGPGSFVAARNYEIEEDPFMYVIGSETLLPPDEKVEYEPEEEDFSAAFDEDTVLYDLEVEDNGEDVKINGVSEYGYGFWTRWSRTYPKYLFPKQPWHNVARFTTNRHHGDAGFADRTLALWIGVGYYHFATYTIPFENRAGNIPYGQSFEGYWNYIYYCYKKREGHAKGYVFFSQLGETEEVAIEA